MAEVNFNFRSLRELIVAVDAHTPIVVRAVTPAVQKGQWSSAGPMANPSVASTYVRLESLPKELQERIKTALESMAWG
jgi:hypothetical protein